VFTINLQQNMGKTANKSQHESLKPQQSYFSINRKLLQHVRDNTQKWLNAFTIRLHVSEGRMEGYHIESVQKAPLADEIGLQVGDIIKAVNGIPVSQPELFAKTINTLIDKSEISILVERGHNLHNIIFSVK